MVLVLLLLLALVVILIMYFFVRYCMNLRDCPEEREWYCEDCKPSNNPVEQLPQKRNSHLPPMADTIIPSCCVKRDCNRKIDTRKGELLLNGGVELEKDTSVCKNGETAPITDTCVAANDENTFVAAFREVLVNNYEKNAPFRSGLLNPEVIVIEECQTFDSSKTGSSIETEVDRSDKNARNGQQEGRGTLASSENSRVYRNYRTIPSGKTNVNPHANFGSCCVGQNHTSGSAEETLIHENDKIDNIEETCIVENDKYFHRPWAQTLSAPRSNEPNTSAQSEPMHMIERSTEREAHNLKSCKVDNGSMKGVIGGVHQARDAHNAHEHSSHRRRWDITPDSGNGDWRGKSMDQIYKQSTGPNVTNFRYVPAQAFLGLLDCQI